jgi:pimeloyl-ACP methyl ester carboxylesterase
MDGTGDLFGAFAAALDTRISVVIVRYPRREVLDYSALLEVARANLPGDMPFVLLGESFSGPIALRLAAGGPHGLVGLVLCCSFARNPFPMLQPFRPLLRALPIRFGQRLVSRFLFGRYATPQLREALQQTLSRVDAVVLRSRAAEVLTVDVSSLLRHLRLPLLYLRATEDQLVPSSAARFIRECMAGAEVIEVIGPHGLLQAKPTEAAEKVSAFVLRCAHQFSDVPRRGVSY